MYGENMRVLKSLSFALAMLVLSSCAKENYVYIKNPLIHKDYSYEVKSIAGSSSVDMIWIIDNSGSMSTYQKQVMQNAGVFMSEFIKQGVNWKLGLLSTDSAQNPYA